MRLGLLADIHANWPALNAVLIAAKRHKVERLLICGDVVGYYFWPNEVLDGLANWDCIVVRGNHEEMLAAARNNPEYLRKINSKYGKGLSIALKNLDINQLDWLCNLEHPLSLDVLEKKILLCHGSPWLIDEYIYPNSHHEVFARLGNMDFDFICLGHSHHPFIKKIKKTTVINPGSVGQPRNGGGRAHWAILDTLTGEVSLKAQDYDVQSVINYSKIIEPQIHYLANILERVSK